MFCLLLLFLQGARLLILQDSSSFLHYPISLHLSLSSHQESPYIVKFHCFIALRAALTVPYNIHHTFFDSSCPSESYEFHEVRDHVHLFHCIQNNGGDIKDHSKIFVNLVQVDYNIIPITLCSFTQSCPTLCGPKNGSLLCPWNFPGKNTRVGYHFLLQGIFSTERLNPHFLCLLQYQLRLFNSFLLNNSTQIFHENFMRSLSSQSLS